MALLMYSVVRRHLKHVDAYTEYHGGAIPFGFDPRGEEIVGWYTNPPPWDQSYFIFTDVAIHCHSDDGWTRIAYDDIVQCEMPHTKSDTTGLRIMTKDGIRFIRCAGRSGPCGKYSDAFALVSVLGAVVLANKRKDT